MCVLLILVFAQHEIITVMFGPLQCQRRVHNTSLQCQGTVFIVPHGVYGTREDASVVVPNVAGSSYLSALSGIYSESKITHA